MRLVRRDRKRDKEGVRSETKAAQLQRATKFSGKHRQIGGPLNTGETPAQVETELSSQGDRESRLQSHRTFNDLKL